MMVIAGREQRRAGGDLHGIAKGFDLGIRVRERVECHPHRAV
jgi:hypothetical protein